MVSRCIISLWPTTRAERCPLQLSLRRESAASDAQLRDTFLRVKVGPVRQREIAYLARVIGPVGEVEFPAGDIDGAQPAPVLQEPDIGERRAVPDDEIGGASRF